MTEVNRRLKERRSAGGEESGFTLIELLIVIVVLGILAAIVVFALSGVTGKSETAACQSDAKTVGVAVAALQAENPALWNTTTFSSTNWHSDLLANSSGSLIGAPFLQSWPTGNTPVYTIEVAGGNGVANNTTTGGYTNGHVIVYKVNKHTSADATADPVGACKNL